MLITSVEPITTTKYKVFIEEQFAFVLYKGELLRYDIKVNQEIDSETFDQIKMKVILKRAKLRTMHLLEAMDRTEAQLRKKLEQNNYPGDIIDLAITYVKGFGYINDISYAKRYITSKQKNKSKKEIFFGLSQKGLSKREIELALEECYSSVNEKEAILELIKKKKFVAETATEQERQKIYAFLMRKGFRYEDIRQVIHVSTTNA